jgi:predicted RNA-binding Zn-ribbon protein involved in translation (DUF1610 family)
LNSHAHTCNLEILLAIVERFTSIGEAEAAVTALDAGGIEVALFDDLIVALDWMYSNAVGGIKVVVREEDYDAAADILDFPAEETQESVEDDASNVTPGATDSPYCPSCGSTAIASVAKFRIFVSLAVLLCAVGVVVNQFGLTGVAIAALAIVILATSSHRCTSCGEAFTWRKRAKLDESPLPQDLIDEQCPHCGSTDVHRLYHRRLKAVTMFQLFTILVVPLSLFPKRVCGNCGRKSY